MTSAEGTTAEAAAARLKPFANYLEVPSRVPQWVWWLLRLAAFAATIGIMALLVVDPQKGLDLFWKLAIPVLPLVFAVVPGFWRQVCPMALVNQIPRIAGFSGERTLPLWLKTSAYLVSVLLFVGAVLLRPVLFNTQSSALFGLMLIALVAAFAGGVVFKGRSGWCGTFCPLAPIQKAYGQAPLLLVKNGYCPTCVGCQKNCYDFNPRAALHSDLADSDEWYSGHRELFVAALPGLIFGFFTAPSPSAAGLGAYFGHMGLVLALSMGIYMAVTRILAISRYKSALTFSMLALVLFYWFASPLLASGLAEFTGVALPGAAAYVFFAAALLVAGRVAYLGLDLERAFARLSAPAEEPQVGVELDALRAAGAPGAAEGMVSDRGSGRAFAAMPDRSLLEGLESAGVKIDYGCRMGTCGADPVAIIEGDDQLSPASDTERQTLERLGLAGRARMACVCKARSGGVVIDTKTDPRSLPEPEPTEPSVDHGVEAGVGRVVIVGNGAAGTTAADEVRRLSPSCTIDLVARENEHFYNRMAIARLLYGRTAMAGMFLNPPDWAEKKNVTVWLNTTAATIDRENRNLVLGTGETLDYDKLILAQGSSAAMPPIPGSDLAGCFVLREASDAMAIRAYRQGHGCETAVVLGGGVLGIEAADALRRLNLEVTILQLGPRLMNRQLDEKGGRILERYLEGLGIGVRTGIGVENCVGTDRLTGVALKEGEVIPADIMVACAGIRPNIEIARTAGLDVGRGVKVDTAMRSSDPDILAIGDVAELPDAIGGLWAVSSSQGRVAAATIFGQNAEYTEPNTLVSLKMDGIDVKGYGAISAEGAGQELLTDPHEDEDTHRLVVLEGSRLLGAVFVGPPGTGKPVPELIERRADLGEIATALRGGDWSVLDTL